MKPRNLKDLFTLELSDMYNAEKQLLKALPKMARAATDAELQEAFMAHLDETHGQIIRIEKAAAACDIKLITEKCDAMQGLITEGEEVIKEVEAGPLLDVALIAAAQKVEHYEIAGYGTLIALAKLQGFDAAVQLLGEILDQEKAADDTLTALAEGGINNEAAETAEAA